MAAKSLTRRLETLEKRWRDLQEQARACPEAREALGSALEAVSQALAALRAAGETLPAATACGPRTPAGKKPGTLRAAFPPHYETILDNVFKAIPDLLTVIDRDYHIVMSNWHHPQVPEEFLCPPLQCYRVYHGRQRPCKDCHVQKVFASGQPLKLEETNDFIGRTLEINAFPIKDESGRVVLVAEHVRDIRERYLAAKALEESEARSKTLFEYAPDAYFLMDLQGNFLDVNRAFEALTGYLREELIGQNFPLLEDQQRALAAAELAQSVNGQPLSTLEFSVTHKDGRELILECKALKLQVKGQDLVLVSSRDITARKRAEEALKESEARFRSLFEYAPDAYLLMDLQGKFLDINRAFEELTGYVREDLIGQHLPLLDEREQKKVLATLEQAQSGQPLRSLELFLSHMDGRELILEGKALPLQFKGENLVLAIARDITDRKRAEAALKESEERFKFLFDYAPEAFFLMDLQGKFVDVNRSVEELTGYAREEMIGEDYRSLPLFDDQQQSLVAALLQKSVQGEMLGPVELCLHRKDGGTVIIEGKGLPLQVRGDNLILGIARDITARKQAEETLAAHLQFLQLLLDAIPNPIFFKDVQGVYLGCNKAFESFLGITREAIVGKNVHDLTPRELADEYRRMDLEAFQTPGTQVYASRVLAADGSRRHVVFHKATFPDSAGAVGGLVGVILDVTDLKRAEESLRESEGRFRAVFEYAPVGIGMADLEGRVLQTNQALQTLLGYSAEEFKTINIQEMTSPEDWPKTLQFLKELLAGERQHFSLEKRYLRKDGALVWAQVMVALLRDPQGEPQYLLGTIIDITARKQAEDALRESEQRFRDIAESAAERVWEVDAKGKYVYSSPVVEQLLGYKPEEVLGKHFYDFFIPEERGQLKKVALAIFAAGQPFKDFLNPNLHKNGQVVWLSTSGIPILDEQGNLQGYRGADIDISRPREAEEFSRNLIAKSSFGIYLLQDRKFRQVNQLFFTITGYDEDELMDLEPFKLIHPEDRQATRDNVIRMLKGLSSVPYEYRTITKGGEIKWIMETVTSIQYQGQRAVLGYFIDITERKQLENQLLQAQKMEAVGRLAGGVAHDFNNLLMAISGYGELMRAKVHKDDPLYDHLENMLKASERAAGLTRQLLTFSRQQIAHSQIVDLNRVVLDMEPMLRRLLGEDVELGILTDPQPAAVKADPGYLGQIIMNLMVNARDAMPRGGRLTLKTAAVEIKGRRPARFGPVPPGAYVLLVVQDTGLGMDEATQTHIFEPFFTTKGPGKGTGLGLSTVYGIVHQSGGYIAVDSQPGVGSTFSIYLPRLTAITQPPQVKIPLTAEFRGKETILLVEDEDVLRNLLTKFLRYYGYTVLDARHGGEALLLCERHPGPIHLMVTDVVMPQMSGRELAERLAPLRPDMKVVYMSGYADDSMVEYGLADLSVPFLQKPFKPIELARKVHAVLHLKVQE